MHYAITSDGKPFFADSVDAEGWEALREYCNQFPDEFRMPCCSSRVVLKTGSQGTQHFAHYSDECSTAPETVWHLEGKALVVAALKELGLEPRLEVAGGTAKEKWKADVYVEHNGRRIAIELQRSYQHFRDFMKRQDRYNKAGVECYWLVREEGVWHSLLNSTTRHRIKNEWNGNPPASWFPAIPQFFAAVLRPDTPHPVFTPGSGFSVAGFVSGVIEGRLAYLDGKWQLTPA